MTFGTNPHSGKNKGWTGPPLQTSDCQVYKGSRFAFAVPFEAWPAAGRPQFLPVDASARR